MAVYAPVLDGNGTLTGLVKTEKELGSVEQRASLDTRALTGAILSGVFLAAAAVIPMIGLALRPLKQLSSFMDRLEEGRSVGGSGSTAIMRSRKCSGSLTGWARISGTTCIKCRGFGKGMEPLSQRTWSVFWERRIYGRWARETPQSARPLWF